MNKAGFNRIALAGLFLLGALPQLLNGFYNPGLMAYPSFFWTVDILTLAVLPLLIYLVGLRRSLYSNADLGLTMDLSHRREQWRLGLSSVVLTGAIYYGYWFFMWLGTYLYHLFFQAQAQDFVFDFSMAVEGQGALRVIIIIYFSVTGGLVEEFYYRGLLKLLFPPGRLSSVLYVVCSGLVFGLIHWEGGSVKVFATFMLGLITAGSYLWTRNLWPLILGHLAADLLLFGGSP